MSQASAWAAEQEARRAKISAWPRPPHFPGGYFEVQEMSDGITGQFIGGPGLKINQGASLKMLTSEQALALAAWIIATFGETPAPASADRREDASDA